MAAAVSIAHLALPLAHIRHWYSALAFVVPMLGVYLWLRVKEWRARRVRPFAELWVLRRVGDRWELVETLPDRAGKPRLWPGPSPWAAAAPTPRASGTDPESNGHGHDAMTAEHLAKVARGAADSP